MDGREDHNMDVRANNGDDPSMSDKNLVNFDPVTSEFCWHIYARRATRWAYFVLIIFARWCL